MIKIQVKYNAGREGHALLFEVWYSKKMISIYFISLISYIDYLIGILVELDERSHYAWENILVRQWLHHQHLKTMWLPIQFFIKIVISYDFTKNISNKFINSYKENNRSWWAVQLVCTLNRNPIMNSIWKIKFKIYFKHFPYILTFTLHSH